MDKRSRENRQFIRGSKILAANGDVYFSGESSEKPGDLILWKKKSR